MALQHTIQLSGETTVKIDQLVFPAPEHIVDFNAYIKVECVTATKNSINAVVSFASGDCRYERVYTFNVVLDGDNFIKQAYLHLKTLPEFADATDC